MYLKVELMLVIDLNQLLHAGLRTSMFGKHEFFKFQKRLYKILNLYRV
jgi:hypothetical protein